MRKKLSLGQARAIFIKYGERKYSKQAFHRLIKKYNPNDENNKEAAQEIIEAWALLKDLDYPEEEEPNQQEYSMDIPFRGPGKKVDIIWPWHESGGGKSASEMLREFKEKQRK